MKEYKATWLLRIGVLVLMSPVFSIGALAIFNFKEFEVLSFMLLAIPTLVVIAVWVYYGSIKIVLHDNSLTKETILGETRIDFSDDLHIFLDVRTPLGDVANALVNTPAKSIASRMSSETKLHINIVVKNKDQKIMLDSNIKGIAELSDRLSGVLLENRYPDLAKKYESGEAVSLGPISIQNGLLSVGNKTINTEDISKFETNKRKLVIGSKDKVFSFAKIPTSKIPNMVCLFSLVNSKTLAQ